MSSPPTVLGQYQIIREIARSNDIVYEAYDPQMDRRVALKELNMPSGITDAQREDRVQRFDREAKAAGRLAHPNIMRVFQVASDGTRHYMAMEFLDGHTLRNEIDTKGFLPVDRAIEISIAVLKGLGHAHSNGVVHRDIKPDNIQLLSSGEIKITDFGIARLTFQPNLTMDGQVFGTPSYMSPEQVVGKEIDARSDLFSVGVLLYEMVSGAKPFPGDSVVAITYAIMNKEPDVLSQVNHSMWQVINRALDKSPALRYASAQEMVDALEQASQQSVVLDAPSAPPGQTIYGPAGAYPMAPPVLNPYGPQYGAPQNQMIAPPPVVYPYNPYQQGPGGAAAPHTPTYQQGFPQTPVYYPPPPPKPLFKPETKHFLGKLFLTLVVMGTFVAVVLLFVSAVGQALQQKEAQNHDRDTMAQIEAEFQSQDPVQSKIDKVEPLLSHLKSEANQNHEKKQLAVLYEEVGKGLMNKGDDASAEFAFQRANSLDAENPKLISDLAGLYWHSGQSQSDPSLRIDTFTKSVVQWKLAADATAGDLKLRDQYLVGAGQVYKEMVIELQRDPSRREDAATIAREGMGVVPENSQIHRELSDLNDQISRG